jgi:hypothetical protein
MAKMHRDWSYRESIRGLTFIAAMICGLAVLPTLAQRAGAHGAGGSGRNVSGMGMGPGHPSFSSAPRARFGVPFHSGMHHGCSGCSFRHTKHVHFQVWPYAYRYPYYGYGLGYSSYSPSSGAQDDRSDLARQIDDLSEEVQRLRQRQEESAYEPPQIGAPENNATGMALRISAESRKDLPTILVFRDQRIQEVQNYAIMGNDLVVVGDQRSTKIPLERLDLAATAKLNDERGVDFIVPR